MYNVTKLTTIENINDIPKPYTYRKVKSGWFFSKFIVLYENTKVYEWSGDEENLIELVKVLNNVYLIGAVDQMARSKFGRN